MTSTEATFARIDAWRLAAGLSFKEVGTMAGLHENTVINVLRGRRRDCTIKTLRALEALVPADFEHPVSSSPHEEGEQGTVCREICRDATKNLAVAS